MLRKAAADEGAKRTRFASIHSIQRWQSGPWMQNPAMPDRRVRVKSRSNMVLPWNVCAAKSPAEPQAEAKRAQQSQSPALPLLRLGRLLACLASFP